jgi:hypothetical protein
MVFRRDITYGLVALLSALFASALLSALFASALLSDPTWAQSNEGCPGPVQVARFEGQENRNTDDFNITGDTFRVRYTITELDRDPVLFDRFLIRPRENDLGVGQSILVFEPGSGSENILEGPGTFDLQIESDGFQYTVFVDDCRATDLCIKV